MKRILAPNPWRIIIAILVTLSVSNSNGTDTESASISSAFNHTEFMINHLWSKGNTTRERNHRNRPDPVEETSTQSSSAAEAEDRTFFKPYQFPFWGLHYGIPSPSGLAFPFVPRGPGFRPFDGIFRSPIGPGKFPSGRPIPVQGPSDSSLNTRTSASTLTSSTSTSAPSPEDTNTSNDFPTEGRTKRYPRAAGYRRKKRRRRPCCYTTTTPAPDEDDHYYPEESDEDQPSGYYDYHNYETVMERPNYPKYMATEPPAPPHSYQRPHTEYHHAYKQYQRPSPSYDTDHGPHAYSIPMTPPRPKYRNAPGQSPPKYRSRPPPYKMRRPPPTYDQPEKTKKRPPSNSQWYRSRPKPPPPDRPSMYSPEDIPSPYDEEQHDSYSHSNDHPKPYYPSYWNHVSMSQTSTTTAPSTSPVPHNLGSSPVILNVSPCQLYTIFPNLLSPSCTTSTTSTTTPKSTTVTYVNDRSDSSSTITISLPYQHWLYPPPWYTTPRPQYSIPPSLLDNVTPPPQHATPPPHQAVYSVLPPLLQYVLPSPIYATPPVSPTISGPPSAPQFYPGYYSLPTPEVTSTTTPSPQPLYVVLPPGVAPPAQNAKPVYIQQALPTPTSEKDVKPQQIIYLRSPPDQAIVTPPGEKPPNPTSPPLQSIYYMHPPELMNTSPAPPTTSEKPQSQPVYIIYAPHPQNAPPPPSEEVIVKSEPTITPPVQPVYVMYPPHATPQTVTPQPQSVVPSSSPQPIYIIYAPPPTSSPPYIPTPPVPDSPPQSVHATDPSPSSRQPFYYTYEPPTTTESALQTSFTFNKPPPLSNYPTPQVKSAFTDTYSNPVKRPRQPVYFMYPHTTSPRPTSSVTPPQYEHFEPPSQPEYTISPEFAYGEERPEFSDEESAPHQTEDVPPYQFTYSSPTHRFIYSMPGKPTLETSRLNPSLGTPPQYTVEAPPETIYVRPTPVKSTYNNSLYLPHFTSPLTPLPDSNPRDTQFPPGYDNIENFQGTSQSESIETPLSQPYEPPDPDIYPTYYNVHNFDSPAPSSLNQESIPPPYRAYGGSRVRSHVRTQPYPYPNPSKKPTNHVSIVYPERHNPLNLYSHYPKGFNSRDSRSYTSTSGTVIDNGATSTFYQDPIPSESRTYSRLTARNVRERAPVFDAEEATLQIEALPQNSTVHANVKRLSSPVDDPNPEGHIVSNHSTNTDTSTQIMPRASETPKATTSVTEKPSNAHQYNLNS